MVSTTQRERSDRCGVRRPPQISFGDADRHPLSHLHSVLKELTPEAQLRLIARGERSVTPGALDRTSRGIWRMRKHLLIK